MHINILFVLGIPGEKGALGEKGYPGEETYGIMIVYFCLKK
jgi:hypothetical protein